MYRSLQRCILDRGTERDGVALACHCSRGRALSNHRTKEKVTEAEADTNSRGTYDAVRIRLRRRLLL